MSRTVDRRSGLWRTCVHEAGHYEVARALGWVADWPTIRSAHSGRTPSRLPGGAVELSDRTKYRFVEKAVIDLAGGAAARKAGEWAPSGCGSDRSSARSALRGTGTSMGQAERRAKAEVARLWRRIQATADQLYREHAR